MILLIPSQHYVVWFAVYSVYSLLLDLPATLPKLYCCYICHRAINSFNLNKDSTKVQILTSFLVHSIHHVALRITLTSITCLPLQGLPTVNSVCPLSSYDSLSLKLALGNLYLKINFNFCGRWVSRTPWVRKTTDLQSVPLPLRYNLPYLLS